MIEELVRFAEEREQIRIKREGGEPPPWTQNKIFRLYRFCNVRREDDTVTRWIKHNWREPHAGDPDLWFAMMVARFVNWPETLAELGYPVPWHPLQFLRIMSTRKAAKAKMYGNGYMIRSDTSNKGGDKAHYQVQMQFNPLWNQRELLRPKVGDTLNSYHMTLGQLYGLSSFMAAQIVADLKYVSPLQQAPDWWTFAASGPGSRRGLNRVLGRPVKASWKEDDWRLTLDRLYRQFQSKSYRGYVISSLHCQDLQNVLCEFDKYERARLGEGRPKEFFRGESGYGHHKSGVVLSENA